MTRPVLLLALALSMLALGCSSAPEEQVVVDENKIAYEATMRDLGTEIVQINKMVTGGQYSAAQRNTARAIDVAASLGRFDPPGVGVNYEAYTEYQAQINDARNALDRLLYFVEQRRRADAREQLARVAVRYNTLSATYGPGNQIGVLERPASDFRPEKPDTEDLPRELRMSR